MGISTTVIFGIITACNTVLFGSITAYIAWMQHRLAKEQKNIAENKLKLELFEQRIEIYQIYLNMAFWVSKIEHYNRENKERSVYDVSFETSQDFEKKYQENFELLISFGERSRFLMNEEVYKFLSKSKADIFTLYNLKVTYKKVENKKNNMRFMDNDVELKSLDKKIQEENPKIERFYSHDLPQKMIPFLKIPENISEKA